MITKNIEKIKNAVDNSRNYPNAIIEYNFDEKIDEDLFDGVKFTDNKGMEKNSAKIIYKFN